MSQESQRKGPTSGEVWETSGEPLDCCWVPQRENFRGSRRKTSGEVRGTFEEVRGLSRRSGEPDSLPATRQICLQKKWPQKSGENGETPGSGNAAGFRNPWVTKQRKTKGQQLKGKIVSALFHTFWQFSTHFHTFSEFFRIFPPGLFLRIKGFYCCFS